MKKSSKLVVCKKRRLLLVRRRKDRKWTLPGGRRNKGSPEAARECLRRELQEELPKLQVKSAKAWRTLRRMKGRKLKEQTIFVAQKVSGPIVVGNTQEIDRAKWRKPDKLPLTPVARYARDQLFRTNNRMRHIRVSE